jgi:hypothetical protein
MLIAPILRRNIYHVEILLIRTMAHTSKRIPMSNTSTQQLIGASAFYPIILDMLETSKVCSHDTKAFVLQEHILQNLADGITVQDLDFNIIFQNSVMVRAFGNHIGEKCYAIYEKRSAVCEGCGIKKAFSTGEPTMVQRTAIEADGKTSFWENACFPIFNDRQDIIAGVEVCRNVTTRVSLEQEVKDKNILLGQLNERLKEQAVSLLEAQCRGEKAEKELKLEMERRERMEA